MGKIDVSGVSFKSVDWGILEYPQEFKVGSDVLEFSGAIGFHRNGFISEGNLNVSSVIGDVKCRDGVVNFYESGSLLSAVLYEDTFFDIGEDLLCGNDRLYFRGSRVIKFYDGGVVESGYLVRDFNFCGICYLGGSRLEFYRDGRVKCGILGRDVEIGGEDYVRGNIVSFDEDGVVSLIEDEECSYIH